MIHVLVHFCFQTEELSIIRAMIQVFFLAPVRRHRTLASLDVSRTLVLSFLVVDVLLNKADQGYSSV